jgi:DNA processing protein
VVGSRSATTYGTGVAGDIAAHVAGRGGTVVSGAAFGIDQAAHRGALGVRGPTVAVLACGVDRAYPTAHRSLLDYVAEVGAVVSELRPGCAPTRVRFLSRNRLIAAMTSGTVVVEAAVRSGALNTANWAGRLHRVVMGVPGPVTSAPSEGVHELLRSGAASVVTRGEHVLELMSPAGEHLSRPPRAKPTARDRLDQIDARVLEAVPLVEAASSSSIARTAGLASAAVSSALARLAAAGWVCGSGGRWRRAAEDPR